MPDKRTTEANIKKRRSPALLKQEVDIPGLVVHDPSVTGPALEKHRANRPDHIKEYHKMRAWSEELDRLVFQHRIALAFGGKHDDTEEDT